MEQRKAECRLAASRVADWKGVPTLFVNGEPFPAAAYMTYLEERGRYADFAAAGYTLFSVPVLFVGRWISTMKDMKPFHAGIFDKPGQPDYTVADASMKRILDACPNGWIIPRVNLAMPQWWIDAHPACTDGTGDRESFFSDEWLRDVQTMLRDYIDHINASDYAPHIAAIQLADGNTEEWFHFDGNGGLSPAAEAGFQRFLEEHEPRLAGAGLPDTAALTKKGVFHGDALLERYLQYANERVPQVIAALARTVKEQTGGQTAVGVFYGYTLEVSSPLWGSHALTNLLNCPDVDFLCSPCSYLGVRDPGADFTEMYPADSVRLHGKLCMQECDIRTHLTRPLCLAAPEYDPERHLTAPIWNGPNDRETAVAQMRKAFARQLVKGNGFWWFDMWGGWYDDPALMDELRQYRELYAASFTAERRAKPAEIAVFIDETSLRRMTDCAYRSAVHAQRKALGLMGTPYDCYDLADFDAVYDRYRAVFFVSVLPSLRLADALKKCKAAGVAVLQNAPRRPTFTADRLRRFCRKSGVHLYCETDEIVYVNDGYLALHSPTGGEKTVRFPAPVTLTPLLGDSTPTTVDTEPPGTAFRITVSKGQTLLFAVTDVTE